MIRWAWRLFCREWRQQLLILVMLIVAVGTSIIGAAVATTTPPSARLPFGSASQSLSIPGGPSLASDLTNLAKYFQPLDVIEHQSLNSGTTSTIELRAQNPSGPYGRSLVTLLSGRYPTSADQVALTPAVASTYATRLGGTFRAGARRFDVVGIVENPLEYADEFALVSPGALTAPTSATVLFDATNSAVRRAQSNGYGLPAGATLSSFGAPGNTSQGISPAVLVLIIEIFGMLFIGLVSVAGFTVLAQRRRRGLGLLAAMGAIDRHVRLVLVANGALVGVVGSVVGFILGLGGWLLYHPTLESSAGHEIAPWHLPWAVVGLAGVLAILTSMLAARWPARAAARVPIVVALSGRPEPPVHHYRSALASTVLLGAGVVVLFYAGQQASGGGLAPLFLIGGLVLVTMGGLSLTTQAIATLGPLSRRAPLSFRLALRDLARYRSRSSASLGAISFAVMLAVIICVATTGRYADPVDYFAPNLPANQLLVYAPGWNSGGLAYSNGAQNSPISSTKDVTELRARVATIASTLRATDVTPLEATSLNILKVSSDGTTGGPGIIYEATPALLRHYGITAHSVNSSTVLLTSRARLEGSADLELTSGRCELQRGASGDGTRGCLANPSIQTLSQLPTDANDPNLLITPTAVQSLHVSVTPAVWIISTPTALSAVQINDARRLAQGVGASIETKNEDPSLSTVTNLAVLVGLLLALGVLAMTLTLLRSETSRDLRVLAAAGAAPRTRRALTGATASVLGFIGALLGTIISYLALIAFSSSQQNVDLTVVPVRDLLSIVVGLPLIAYVGGWLLAGREPRSLARRPFE